MLQCHLLGDTATWPLLHSRPPPSLLYACLHLQPSSRPGVGSMDSWSHEGKDFSLSAHCSIPHAQNSTGTRQVPMTCPPSEQHKEGPLPLAQNQASQQEGARDRFSPGPHPRTLQPSSGFKSGWVGWSHTRCFIRGSSRWPDPCALHAQWVAITARLARSSTPAATFL